MAKTQKTITIRNMDDVDKALRQLSECTRRIEQAEAQLKGDVDALKARADEEAGDDRALAKAITDALEVYATANRAQLFAAGKQVKRLMGTFGFKESPARLVMDAGYTTDDLVELLKDECMDEYVRVTESANIPMLKNCSTEQLALVHASFAKSETFFVKLAKVTD